MKNYISNKEHKLETRFWFMRAIMLLVLIFIKGPLKIEILWFGSQKEKNGGRDQICPLNFQNCVQLPWMQPQSLWLLLVKMETILKVVYKRLPLPNSLLLDINLSDVNLSLLLSFLLKTSHQEVSLFKS